MLLLLLGICDNQYCDFANCMLIVYTPSVVIFNKDMPQESCSVSRANHSSSPQYSPRVVADKESDAFAARTSETSRTSSGRMCTLQTIVSLKTSKKANNKPFRNLSLCSLCFVISSATKPARSAAQSPARSAHQSRSSSTP